MGTKNGRQVTTLFSDASFCNKDKIAGYGMWGKSDWGKFSHSGFIETVANVNLAEFIASVRTINEAYKRSVLRDGDYVIVKLDNLGVVNFMKGSKTKCPVHAEIKSQIMLFAARRNLQIEYQHVKGHNRDKAPRSYVNNLCDKLAKGELRYLRMQRSEKGDTHDDQTKGLDELNDCKT